MEEKIQYSAMLNPTIICNTCRICLQSDLSELANIHLFTENKESVDILGKIYLCTQILLDNQQHLPYLICKQCIHELENANAFREKCLASENNLKLWYSPARNKNKTSKEYYNLLKLEEDNELHDTLSNEIDCREGNSEQNEYSVLQIEGKNIVNTHQQNIRFYKCDLCDKVLKTVSSLDKHKVSMHQNRKHIGKITGSGAHRRYNCFNCSYSTPYSQTLVNHMRVHSGERPYTCECGKQFTQLSSLTAHRKTHNDTTFFTCSLCGKQFKYKDVLKKHQQVHEVGTFTCDICKKVLKSRQTLQAHLRRHYDIREFNCDTCGATFVTHTELLNHKRKHSIEKTFQCNLCDYKSYRKRTLIIHLKRHTGQREYKCDVCEDSFFTGTDLRRHKRKHSRQKNYSCPTCGQHFAHSSSVNKHMRNIHRTPYTWNDNVDRTIVKPINFLK